MDRKKERKRKERKKKQNKNKTKSSRYPSLFVSSTQLAFLRGGQTGGQNNTHKWFASTKILSVEELETPPAGTKPRPSHYRSAGGGRRGKRKASLDDLPWKDKRGPLSVRRTLEPFKRQTLRKILRDGMERIWAFPSAQIPS